MPFTQLCPFTLSTLYSDDDTLFVMYTFRYASESQYLAVKPNLSFDLLFHFK